MAASVPVDWSAVAGLSGPEARALVRAGGWRQKTVGMAQGWVQANLVVLRAAYAADFQQFCERNAQACPVLDVTERGSPEPRQVAAGADLRTDAPRYRVYRDGAVAGETDTLLAYWRDDLVGFVLGCSFTFEAALAGAGIPLRHMELGLTAPMYVTNRPCEPAGPFAGPLVVTMRPVPERLIEQARAVTARFPRAHGAPVHVGDPAALGIADLARPEWGDAVPVPRGDVPVFWACGVTPQAAAEAARLDLMLTHAPAHMFVTDLRVEDLEDG
jgi:uncharacterized protein YcsI (UPF0317 family)